MKYDLTTVPTVSVHGLPYADLCPEELEQLLLDQLREGQGTAVFTPNAQIGADCLDSPELQSLLAGADVLLPDGAGVLAASRRQTPATPLSFRLAGIEAGESVLRLCAAGGYSVYFLGGKKDVALRAAARWQRRLPELTVAGTHDGYFEKWGEENEAVLDDIRQKRPDAVFVCFGFPKQERWIMENRPALPDVRLFMGLGGSLDVWAGRIRRAPRAFRLAHMEWLWRGLQQPRRLRAVPRLLRYVYTPCSCENSRFSPNFTAQNSQNTQN